LILVIHIVVEERFAIGSDQSGRQENINLLFFLKSRRRRRPVRGCIVPEPLTACRPLLSLRTDRTLSQLRFRFSGVCGLEQSGGAKP